MLSDRPTIGFVAVTDLDRSRDFYGHVLGLELLSDDGMALVFQAGGRMIRIVAVDTLTAQPFTVLGWEVPGDALDHTVDGLSARGVKFLTFDGLDQDERSIWTVPTGDRVAWFTDPDGNVLSLSSHIERA